MNGLVPPAGVALRMLNREDSGAAAALDRDTFGAEAWSQELFTEELDSRWGLYLGAYADGHLVGMGGIKGDMTGDLMTLAVRPDWRGQGLGRHLCQSLLEKVADRGMAAVLLEVRVSNSVAIDLYTDLGFVQVRRIPRYYVGPVEDAVMMRMDL